MHNRRKSPSGSGWDFSWTAAGPSDSRRFQSHLRRTPFASQVEHLENRTLLTGYDPHTVLVGMQANADPGDVTAAVPGASIEPLGDYGLYKVTLPEGTTVENALATLDGHASLRYSHPDYIRTIEAIPDDPDFDQLWGLNNTGQTGGTDDADMDLPETWDFTTGSNQVIIGVVDTGIDWDHPDLAANMWVNTGETPGDGIDNDNNGYIDDIHGYDFGENDSDPDDANSHGPHVAVTIGGLVNFGIGVVGVNWNVKLMALKGSNASHGLPTSATIAALNYAVDHGAQISNHSYGGAGGSQAESDAIQNARDNGHLFVAAAGNNGTDNDTTPFYPASHDLDNIISVAATNDTDDLAGFSCFGATSVDVGAPGVGIWSTVPVSQGSYGSKQGTSMASPQVAGLAGLALSVAPDLTYAQLRDAIYDNVDPLGALDGKVATGGRVNAFKVIDAVRPKAPETPVMEAPNGTIADATPTYRWSTALRALHYELVVTDADTNLEVLHLNNLATTSYTPPDPLVEGNYEAKVQAVGENDIVSGFSNKVSFSINIPDPTQPVFTAPDSLIEDSTPTFEWTEADNAHHYELNVRNQATNQRVIVQRNLTGTAYTHFLELTDATYVATIRAVNEVGETSETDTLVFAINAPAPGVPTLTGPASLITDSFRPTITWTEVAGGDRYDLWLEDTDRGIKPLIREEFLTTNFYTPIVDLQQGFYRVWVRANTISGTTGDWSQNRGFTIDFPEPERPEITFPETGSQVDSLTVNFQWTNTANTATWDLWVRNLTTGQDQIVREEYLPHNSHTATLPDGRYVAWVQAENAAGEVSPWSAASVFYVGIPRPEAPVLTGPVVNGRGSTSDSTPEFSWTSVQYGEYYDLWVRDLTTGADQVVRDSEIDALFLESPVDLSDGLYRSWVRAFNEIDQPGPWSSSRDFIIDTPTPTIPKLDTLPGIVRTRTPLFTWSEPAGSASFQLYIQNLTRREVTTVNVTQSFYQSETDMKTGSYKVWVRAFNSAGEGGAWSTPIGFILVQNESSADPAVDETAPGNQDAGQLAWANVSVDATLPGETTAERTQGDPAETAAERKQVEVRKTTPAQTPLPGTYAEMHQAQAPAAAHPDVLEAVMQGWPEAEWWLPSVRSSTPVTANQDS